MVVVVLKPYPLEKSKLYVWNMICESATLHISKIILTLLRTNTAKWNWSQWKIKDYIYICCIKDSPSNLNNNQLLRQTKLYDDC